MPAGQAFARREVVGFVGFTSKLRAEQASIARTINLILEPTEPGNLKAPVYMRRRPGLSPFAQVDDSPGFTIFHENGRVFGVTGTTFWEAFTNGTTVSRGTVTLATGDLPAVIVSNGTAGNQLLVIAGGSGYVFDLLANTLTKIDTTNFPGTAFPDGSCVGIEFMDGYGIALTQDSREFHISALEDFTVWDPLDVAQRSEASDNLVGVVRVGRQLMFLGNATGEVWSDNGDALFPFAPIPGSFIEWGSAATKMVRYRDTAAWIGRSVDGNGQIMQLDGYRPVAISTPAVDLNLQTSTVIDTSQICTVQMQGHWWLCISVPDLETTWVYDALAGGWVEWGLWDTTLSVFDPMNFSGHVFAFGRSLTTWTYDGVIYELSFDQYSDGIV